MQTPKIPNEIQKYISGVRNSTSPSTSTSQVLTKSNYGWWLILILFVCFLGINIYGYTMWGADYMKQLVTPLMGDGSDTTEKGVNSVVDVVDEGLVKIKENVNDLSKDVGLGLGLDGSAYSQEDIIDTNTNSSGSLDETINTNRNEVIENDKYKPSNAEKWCYVGEYNGIRTCRQLDEGGTCMSGNIFPSKDVCINPKLRQNN